MRLSARRLSLTRKCSVTPSRRQDRLWLGPSAQKNLGASQAETVAGRELSGDAHIAWPRETPALSCQQVERIKKPTLRVASALGRQDQGCCVLVLQLGGKIRQACLNTALHQGLSAEQYGNLPFVLCQP